MMMNVIAISVLAVSVVFAGGGNTKVSAWEANPGFISAAEDQLSAAAAAVVGVAQDANKAAAGTTEKEEGGWANRKIPRELICDSSGNCKHKLSDAFSKAKRMVTETAQEFEEGVKEAAEVAAEKAKEMVSEATRRAGDDKTKEGIPSDAATSPAFKKLLDSFAGMVHLLGFATAYGMAMWVSFGMSHVLSSEQFALLQTRVYPLYFKAMASSLGLALMGHSLWHRNHHNVTTRLQECNLVGLIALVLANLLYLEPRSSKAMFVRMKLEKEEGKFAETTATTQGVATGEDNKKTKMEKSRTSLRKLNSYSYLLNVITLMGLTWHLMYLSQRLCRE